MVNPRLKDSDTYSDILDIAEHLFRQLGYSKTTISDIARELHMSPANIYRFFTTKGEINEAVAGRLLAEVETGLQKLARSPRSGNVRLRDVILKVEKENVQRYESDRKLHDLLERAFDEHWPIIATHIQVLDEALIQVISDGMSAGEFRQGCAKTAAGLVRNACLRFFHPRFLMERAQAPEPTVNQMVHFCLAALAK